MVDYFEKIENITIGNTLQPIRISSIQHNMDENRAILEHKKMENNEPFMVEVSYKELKPIRESKVGIFVDLSTICDHLVGDRSGLINVLEAERQLALEFMLNIKDGSYCIGVNEEIHWIDLDGPMYIQEYRSDSRYECNISKIFDECELTNIIENLNTIIILTSGSRISDEELARFGYYVGKKGMNLGAIIFVIIGEIASNSENRKPMDVYVDDVKKFVSVINTNGCIIFYNVHSAYIMWARGCFKNLWNSTNITENTKWEQIAIGTEICEKIVNVNVPEYDPDILKTLRSKNYISIEPGKFLNPELMLEKHPPIDDFLRIPYHIVCLHFLMNNQTNKIGEFGMMITNYRKEFIQRINDITLEIDLKIELLFYLDIAIGIVNTILAQQNVQKKSYTWFFVNNYLQIRLYDRNTNTSYQNGEELEAMNYMDENEETEEVSNQMETYYSSDDNNDYIIDDEENKIIFEENDDSLKTAKGWDKKYSVMHQNKVKCTLCYHEKVPFIMFKKLLEEDSMNLILQKNDISKMYEYYDKYIVCYQCASKSIESGRDLVGSCQIIFLFPLVILDDDTKEKFEDYLSNGLVEVKEIINKRPEEMKKKVAKIIALLVDFFSKNRECFNVHNVGMTEDEIENNQKVIKKILEKMRFYFPLNE
ncbi:MAG: hypothetical protein QXW79_00060 [Thermoplasmata archaeon]